MAKGKYEGEVKYPRRQLAQNRLGEADPIAISIAQHAINNQCTPLTDNPTDNNETVELSKRQGAQPANQIFENNRSIESSDNFQVW